MAREIEVTYTVRFSATVLVDDAQTIDDALEAINIPEDGTSAYNDGSFEVEEVRYRDERIPPTKYGKTLPQATKKPIDAVVKVLQGFLDDRRDNPGDPPSYEGLADELGDLLALDRNGEKRLVEFFKIHDVTASPDFAECVCRA